MSERALIVTGASAGIGAAIVDRRLASGTSVVTLQRRAPERSDPKLHHIACDLTNAEATAAAGAEATRRFDITGLVKDDLLQIYLKVGVAGTVYCRNFRLAYEADAATLSVTNQDP